jgi:hypothetical protein
MGGPTRLKLVSLGAGSQEANGVFSVDIRELLYLTCDIVV